MKKKNSKTNQYVVFKKPPLTLRLWNFINPYRKAIILAVFIFLAAGFVLGGWISYRDWREKKAMELFRIAKDDKDFEHLRENYPGTSAALLAMIHLGEIKWKQHQYTQARDIYEHLVDHYPRNVFTPLVKNLIGQCLHQEGKLSEAEGIFESLRGEPGDAYIQSLAELNLGRVIMAKGDSQKAIDLYHTLRAEKSHSVWVDSIDAFIRRYDQSVQK